MKKLLLMKTVLLLFALVVGSSSVWADASDYSTIETSNVTLTAGTNGSSCTVNGEDGIKVGTSKLGGTMTVTVPAGAKYLHLHAAAWNGVTGLSLNITPNTNISPTSIALTADTGVSGNSPFTLSGDPEDFYFVIEFTTALAEQTVFTFTTSTSKRFVIWGVNAEISPTSISLSPNSLNKIVGDDAVTLIATILPATATNKTVTWTTTNSGVASVTNEGVVSFNGAGEATITAKTYNNLTATCTVTVVAGSSPSASLSTSSLAFGDVEVEQTKEMTFTVTPANLEGDLTIASNNEKYTVSPASIAQNVTTAQTITVTAAPTALTDNMDGQISISGGSITTQYVTLTATPYKKYTVSFSDGGSLTETSKASGITLPNRSDSGDYTFEGWSESKVAAGSASATILNVGDTYYPTDDCILYPVYTYDSYGTVEQWAEITTVPTEGEYVIASSNNYAMKASISNNRFENASIEITSGSPATLTNAPESSYIWEISKPDSYFRIKNGSNYAGGTSSKNQGALLTDASDDLAKWTITYGNNYEFENYGRSQASSDPNNKWLRNNGTNGWGTYSSNQDKAPRLFKKIYVNDSKILYTSELGELDNISINEACTDGKGKYYGTYSNSKAFVVPADLTVSCVGVSAGKLVVTDYAAGDVVEANTGVMVSSLAAGSYTISFTNETGTENDGNMLKPSGDAGITADGMSAAASGCIYYRLTMHNGTQLGFWWGAENGASFALAANKAYLAVPTSSARDGLWIDDDATGVRQIENGELRMENSFFNLAGQRVANPTKGLYIVNGKKVIIK